jgi:hypothetical protein
VERIRQLSVEELAAVVPAPTAERIGIHLRSRLD